MAKKKNKLPKRKLPPTKKNIALMLEKADALGMDVAAITNPDRKFVPLLRWMKKYRKELGPGKFFDLKKHKYLATIYDDDCQKMVVCKAGQMGISEYLLSWTTWNVDQKDCVALYVFPIEKHISDFSMARLGPAIEASSHLKGLIKSSRQRGADRVNLKCIGRGFLYFRGGQVKKEDGSAPQLKAIDADVLVLDEYDEMSPKVKPLAVKRLDHSEIKQWRIISTPSFAGVGIFPEFLKTNQMYWHVKCLMCGSKQDLKIDDLVIEWDKLLRPRKWHQKNDGTAYIACRKCGGVLDRLGDGEWIAKHPEKKIHGYHMSHLFSYYTELEEILEDLSSLDENIRQQCFNQDLGLVYQTASAFRLTREVLDNCRREYNMTIGKGGMVTMGVDQGKVINVIIRELLNDGTRCTRYAGVVMDFEELDALITLYSVKICVIDAMPETRKAREFQERHQSGLVWVAYYTGDVGSKSDDPYQWNLKEQHVLMDRTRSMDANFAEFMEASIKGKGKTLPANARNLLDYYDHLISLERRLKKKEDGSYIAVYTKTGDDHYAHAENYERAAFKCPLGSSWFENYT